ncbi:MAG: MazG-like family protein [Candidatus Woesearchaeota archaeon]
MDKTTTLSEIKNRVQNFNTARDWKNLPIKDLILALQEEVGEFARCYLWLSEEEIQKVHANPEKFKAIREELADIYIYLITLSYQLNVDISDIVNTKLAKNELRYPVAKVKAQHTNILLGKKAHELAKEILKKQDKQSIRLS